MMLRIASFLAGLKMTIVGAVFLAASLIIMLSGAHVPVDPIWVTIVICGVPIFYNAIYYLIFDRQITTALLISIAMVSAIVIGQFFAAGEVAFIMAIGGILEMKTVERAKQGIKSLINLAPKQGRRVADGKEEMVPLESLKPGDVIRILPGENVPVDGSIISGDTSLDQSVITGESLPVDKGPGDEVFCGAINCFGAIDVVASKAWEDSSLQKLIRLVQDAENNKAPTQRIVDKWASWLVPAALAIAIVVFVITRDVTRAVTILVVFCPCALALATPTSIMAAIGQATKFGVLIKSGDALERMGKADCVAFDKTGTLTNGNLVVSDVASFENGIEPDELLALAASVEAFSEHPLAKAIVAHAKEKGLELGQPVNFKMIPGKGVSADIEGRALLCGNGSFLSENGVALSPEAEGLLKQLRAQGKATLLVSEDGRCTGVVALSDTLRDSAKSMVAELGATHTGAALLTGDHRQTADFFAAQAGIHDVHSELLPAQKVEKIEEMQRSGRRICMIGDGVNDAPALETAYVGVAMGAMGSDIAIEAADIVLMGDDISKIPYLKRLANATVRLIKVNITISMTLNFVAIVLSILGVLNPVTGAIWHNVGSVLVTLNAALLYDRNYIGKK